MWTRSIPSLRNPTLVPRSASRRETRWNGFDHSRNLDEAFGIAGHAPNRPVLLVDDVIDSGWTMTVAAAMLRRAGSGAVFPVALASAAPR